MTSTDVSVTWPQALAWRLQRQGLEPRAEGTPADVVGRLGAVLSMDESRAELAVRTRRRTSRPGELREALGEGTVIKAFAFRGSMHYLTPESGGDVLALRAAGRQWERASWVDYYGLTAEAWPDFRAAVRSALGAGPLTLAELADALATTRAYRHLKPILDADGWALVKALTWQGDMSLGLPRDGKVTFQRLDANPRWTGIPDLEQAGPRAIAAYLRSYGPATPAQVHSWFGSGLSAGKKRLERWWGELADELVAVDVEGTTTYVVRDDVEALLATTPSETVRLLPGHDQWVMGPGTTDQHVTPPALREAVTRKADLVVVHGVVAGTWARRGDDLTVSWSGEGARPDAALTAEAQHLAGLLGRDLRLHLG